MAKAIILTLGFEEKFAIRMITRHGLDKGDYIVILTGPLVDKTKKVITYLQDFIQKYFKEEIGFEVSCYEVFHILFVKFNTSVDSHLPVGGPQPIH